VRRRVESAAGLRARRLFWPRPHPSPRQGSIGPAPGLTAIGNPFNPFPPPYLGPLESSPALTLRISRPLRVFFFEPLWIQGLKVPACAGFVTGMMEGLVCLRLLLASVEAGSPLETLPPLKPREGDFFVRTLSAALPTRLPSPGNSFFSRVAFCVRGML